tara:strand:+ start:760 stop:1458 length:699 start_codon:yes stop_codon:yes gene_type:complete
MIKLGIYVISYGRSDEIKTAKSVPSSTYVVRKSQEKAYKKAGIKNIWAIEDEKINSWTNVMNYILDNAPETCVVIMDDDLEDFSYVGTQAWKVEDTDIIEDELVRLSQIVYDLDIGHGILGFRPNPRNYAEEFLWHGTGGGTYFFNLDKCKSRFVPEAYASADLELQLQELLTNRIILFPKYFVASTSYNSGTNSQARTMTKVVDSIRWVQNKWGKYFLVTEKLKTRIKVVR